LDGDDRPSPGLAKNEAELANAAAEVIAALKKKETPFFREQGFRYVRGEGLPKDQVEAGVWFSLAAGEGDGEAQ